MNEDTAIDIVDALKEITKELAYLTDKLIENKLGDKLDAINSTLNDIRRSIDSK